MEKTKKFSLKNLMDSMSVHLDEHFTYKKIFKAILAPVFMMVFTSLYSIVDGLFVSNFVNQDAFAALNLISPVIMIIGSLGFMMGAGGSALVGKTLGEGDNEKASKLFSGIVYATIVLGVIVTLCVIFFIEPIAVLLGATGENAHLLPYCVIYGQIIIGAEVAFMLQNLFQTFFVVAERPGLGFAVTAIAGVTNIILDAAFIVGAGWGLAGAAYATIIGQVVGAVLPIIYFARPNKTVLRLGKASFAPSMLFKTVTNGSSELLSNIASSVVGIVYNKQLLKIAGQNGVSAYGVIMYASFIFAAMFIGYTIGTSPIVSYHYGAQNHDELKNLRKKSILITAIAGAVMTIFSASLARPLASIFVSQDAALLDMTTHAMRIYSISFLFMGFNIFTSAFFTALNNGLISAIVSFARTLVFQIGSVLLLPLAFDIDDVWAAIIVAEGLACVMDIIFLIACRKKYNY